MVCILWHRSNNNESHTFAKTTWPKKYMDNISGHEKNERSEVRHRVEARLNMEKDKKRDRCRKMTDGKHAKDKERAD